MKKDRIAKHYALFFFSCCTTTEEKEQTREDAKYLLSLCYDETFRSFLKSPIYRRATQQKILSQMLGNTLSAKTLHFLALLTTKGRLPYLKRILYFFLKEQRKDQGKGRAYLQVAHALTKESEEELVQLIKTLTRWESVKLEVEINPQLLGGYIVEVENQQLDASLQQQLHALRMQWHQQENLSTLRNPS